MGIKRFVLPACADLACPTSELCLGETPFERSQEAIRLAARSVQQRCNIPRAWAVWGGGDREQGRLLLAVVLCPAI